MKHCLQKERFKLKVFISFTANKMMDKLHTEQDKEKEMIQYDQEVFKEIQKLWSMNRD